MATNDPQPETIVGKSEGMLFSAGDREILRRLAGKVAALAGRKVEEEKRALWTAHNDLEETRPLIFCDPERGWIEIIREEMLECRGTLARQWERRLRKEIFWAEGLKDDRVISPHFDLEHVYQDTGWGMEAPRVGGDHGGAYAWIPPMTNYDQMEKLHFPEIKIDEKATREQFELAKEVMGDLLEVRLLTSWWWSFAIGGIASNLRGLDQLMLDMYDHPEELKRLMMFLRDGYLAQMDFLESRGLLASNLEETYVGSGGFGFTKQLGTRGGSPAGTKLKEMWGFCESQETVSVAPEMFEEFVFQYQVPLLERCGLNCYGCCEPLHLRWKVMSKTPRLRRVSVSPWADVKMMADQLQDRYVYSYKAQPSDLALPAMNEAVVRERLRRLREATRGCRVEVIMKDNHTLGGSAKNAVRWVELAREELGR